jgi:hypothetical protein
MKVIKVLSVKRFKVGYEVRNELRESPCKGDMPFEMKSAYTPSGLYIGDSRDAKRLVADRGIQPEISAEGNNVCSIGYSVKDGKWYGWSHRAIYGFKVGSTCKKGDCHYRARRHGGKGAWVAKTTADAKQMAIDFAEGVS